MNYIIIIIIKLINLIIMVILSNKVFKIDMIYVLIINDNVIIYSKNTKWSESIISYSPDKRSPVTLVSGKGEGPRETAGRSSRPEQSQKI